MFKYFAIACLLGVAAGAPNLGYAAIEQDAYPRYSFNYAVNDPHTGDNKAQSEVRDGGVVRGSYSLAEPDGTVRVVDYAADPHSGFNAVVRRLGTAHHPQNYVRAPVIAAPIVAPIAAAPIAYSSSVIGHGGWGGLGLGAYSGLGSGLGLGWGGLGHGGLGHGGLGRGLGWH